ncbi:MAG: ArsR/SmtB family transcription factor [Pirellulales bacterium]
MARARRKTKSPRIKLAMRSERDYQSCAERLKALADPDRLRIVNCLLLGPKNVSQVAKELNETIVKVSHHLRVLRHARVVETKKRGKFVIYSLDPAIADGDGRVSEMKTLDLGCCRLDLVQSISPR